MTARGGGPRVLLLGLMGSGKSRVGEALAARLGVPLLDNDVRLAVQEGHSKLALFEAVGAVAFAEAEVEVALEIIQTPSPFVGGLPSGVLLDPRVRAALKQEGQPFCVWLRARLETLAARLAVGILDRPRLDGDLGAALSRLAPPREAAFEAVADLTLDVEGRTPAELAEAIEKALGSRWPPAPSSH